MAWTVYAERFTDADFSSDPVIYQPFTPSNDVLVKAIRTWVVVYNSPTFTSLSLKIFDDIGGVPSSVRNTFEKTWMLAQIQDGGAAYGIKEIYFDFANPIKLKGGTKYHAVPWVTGSSFTGASHLAWVRGFPDPNLSGVTVKLSSIPTIPYYLAVIGAEL